jgi:hypothetical protein
MSDSEIIKQTFKNEVESTKNEPLHPAMAGVVSGATAGTVFLASLLWGPLGWIVAGGGAVVAYKTGNRRLAAWIGGTGLTAAVLFALLPFLALPLAFLLTVAGGVAWANASK